MIRQRAFSLIIASSLLGGCALDSLPFVYKPDIKQGTILTQEMVDQLRLGMTRRQVQFVLGSPPLVDPFHTDRWDYIEAIKRGGGDLQSKRVTVFFDNDRLVAVEGDLKPRHLGSSPAD
jgi:outer membrane protein assembly factor BamE